MAGLTEFDNQAGGNFLSTVTPTTTGSGGAMTPFSVNPWSSPFSTQDVESQKLGLDDPMAQASWMFQNMYGNLDLGNPFQARFYNDLAPGLGWMHQLGGGAEEHLPSGFAGAMSGYLEGLQGTDWGAVPGLDDARGLFRQIFTGQADNPRFAEFLQGMTDRELMSMFGDVLGTVGHTAFSAAESRGIQNAMQNMLANWRGAALDYPYDQAGNAFMNYVMGSGVLDRLGL